MAPESSMRNPVRPRSSLLDLSDEELDRYILLRLAIVGVDLSVLPEEDETAPADRVRVLRSARNFLRSTVPEISDFILDPQEVPPAFLPASLAPHTSGMRVPQGNGSAP
jgi:hypothetical protein